MENQPKLNNSKEVIAYLAERFPLCFIAEGEARPLKIGIFKDLVERLNPEESPSKTQLRSALRLYTSSWRYLYGVKAGAQRVDLDGNACGDLEAEHIEHARKQLEEAKARVNAQRSSRKPVNKKGAEGETAEKPSGRKQSVKRPRVAQAHGRQEAQTAQSDNRVAKAAHSAPARQPAEKRSMKPVDISQLKIGLGVKVRAGKSSMDATVLEIAKDGIRVQLSSGLAMIVRAEHLQF